MLIFCRMKTLHAMLLMLFVASIFSKPVSIYFLVFFNTVTVNNIQHAVLLLMKLSTVQILSFICADDLIHQIHQIHQTLCNLDSVQRKMIQAEKTARIHRNLNQTSLNQVNLNLQRKISELCQAHSLQLAQQVHRPLARQQHHQLPWH